MYKYLFVSLTIAIFFTFSNVGAKNIEDFGAVSEQVALEMAENIKNKFGTSIGVSTTGIAGPGGGSKNKPVGLVYVGYCDDKSLKVKRNELYWGNSKNKINGIEFIPIDNELTQDRLFRSGGIHLAIWKSQ